MPRNMCDCTVAREYIIYQWFSTFLLLRVFNMVPHVVLTPKQLLIFWLLHNCNFAAVRNPIVNIFGDGREVAKEVMTHRLRATVLYRVCWVTLLRYCYTTKLDLTKTDRPLYSIAICLRLRIKHWWSIRLWKSSSLLVGVQALRFLALLVSYLCREFD